MVPFYAVIQNTLVISLSNPQFSDRKQKVTINTLVQVTFWQKTKGSMTLKIY